MPNLLPLRRQAAIEAAGETSLGEAGVDVGGALVERLELGPELRKERFKGIGSLNFGTQIEGNAVARQIRPIALGHLVEGTVRATCSDDNGAFGAGIDKADRGPEHSDHGQRR